PGAHLPPAVGQSQPDLWKPPAPPPRSLGQVGAPPPPFSVSAAGDQAPPARMAPSMALPTGLTRAPAPVAGAAAQPAASPAAAPGVTRLTLDEVKQRVLANNKLLNLAALNVQSKGYATRAMQASYFPQIIGNVV